jgi:hypothetical protein
MTPQTSSPQESATIATVGSILAVDIGSLYTRAALFDVIGGEYRYVARASAVTTAEAPHNDVTVGAYNAVYELEGVTGRRLTDDTRLRMPQRSDGSGIDLFIVTSSAAPALRLAVASVSEGISGRSALGAAHSTYTHVVSRITLDQGIEHVTEDEDSIQNIATAWLGEQTEKLLAVPPEVVLISGEVEGGPVFPLMRLARVISEAAGEQSHRAERAARSGSTASGTPVAIFAGNSAAAEIIKPALAPISEVHTVPNVRPQLGVEQPDAAGETIAALYRERRVPQIPGYNVLTRWIEGGVVPTAEAERLVARYLYRFYGREALVADLGASSTSLFLASEERDAAVVLGDLGMAYGLGTILAEGGAGKISRWLPFVISEEELVDWMLNKVARPLGLPHTPRDLAIEHVLAREALGTAAEALRAQLGESEPRYDLLIGTGGLLAHCPRPGQAALLLLDALQPDARGLGSVELAIDTTLLLPALGNLARHQLAAASYIFDRDCLVWLGTALVVRGRPQQSAEMRRRGIDNSAIPLDETASPVAVTVTVERQGGGTDTMTVPYGSIRVIPLRPDQRAALRVEPAPGFRVGSGDPGKPLKTQPGQEVKGGLVGLIIDARGRPVLHHDDANTRALLMRRHWAALDAIPSGETFAKERIVPPPPPSQASLATSLNSSPQPSDEDSQPQVPSGSGSP